MYNISMKKIDEFKCIMHIESSSMKLKIKIQTISRCYLLQKWGKPQGTWQKITLHGKEELFEEREREHLKCVLNFVRVKQQ